MQGVPLDVKNTLDMSYRMAVFVFAAVWVFALMKKKRCAITLTSVAFFIPCLMAAYNMIAIWFEDNEVLLNAWITICLVAGIALYVHFVWRRWWLPLRNTIIKERRLTDET